MSGEWRTILGIGGIICVLLAAFAVYSIWNTRNNRKRRLQKIRADWGSWPEREYDAYEWSSVEGFYLNKKTEDFQIDEITWEDLDMSRVFMLLNHTGSFLGEGYLYYLLHTPSFDGKELEERERLIRFFAEHAQEREQLQMFFCETGKAGRNSVFDAVYNLAEAVCARNLHHFLMVGVFLASVVVLLAAPTPGILLLIGAMFATMTDYYKEKRPIEKYIISVRFLLRTLQTAEELRKIGLPEIREYQERIAKAAKAFGKLKRNTFFLMAGSGEDQNLLTVLVIYLNICLHVDLIQFSVIVKEIRDHIGEFEILAEEMGKLESAIAIASFRKCMGDWCAPQLRMGDWCAPQPLAGRSCEGKPAPSFGQMEGSVPELDAQELYHPLIREPVKNSIRAKRGVLLTGSNASGKSTFLKTVAVNAILAQTIHTCLADGWRGNYFRVFSSMALQDNLEGQESYYIVEIKSLKRILDQIEIEEIESGEGSFGTENGNAAVPHRNAAPVLCFVDEVLRGTNTVERIAASSQVLRYMTDGPVLCFAATHDIELTHILEEYYDNYHFEEEMQENDVRFDYRLRPGRATSRNAIKLLSVMGYEEGVIRRAEAAAEHFLKTGEWKKQERGNGSC